MMSEKTVNQPVMELLITIVDRTKASQALAFFGKKAVTLSLSTWGRGTASSEIMDILGITERAKVVIFSIAPKHWVPVLLTEIADAMQLRNVGRGIIFTVPLDAVNKGIIYKYEPALAEKRNEERVMYKTNEKNYELIIAAIEAGLADAVMEKAREAGAKGGTIWKARAPGDENTESFFGLKLYDEMEILAIAAESSQKIRIMEAIGTYLNEKSPDKGFVFSIPVTDIVGVGIAPEESGEK
jgi:nitrogen regulatory protein PII